MRRRDGEGRAAGRDERGNGETEEGAAEDGAKMGESGWKERRKDANTLRKDAKTRQNDLNALQHDSNSFKNDSKTLQNDSKTLQHDSNSLQNDFTTYQTTSLSRQITPLSRQIDGPPSGSAASPRGSRAFGDSGRGAWAALCRQSLSPITAVFSFLLRSESTCGSCGATVVSTQPSTSLSLPIPAGNGLQVTVILYHPWYLDASLLIAPKPRQLALLVPPRCSLPQLQALLAQADLMHAPAESYALHAASGRWKPGKPVRRRVATADWVDGRLTAGRNLVCRVLPNAGISAGMERVAWVALEVSQNGRLKKLPRSLLLGLAGLTAGKLRAQLDLLCRNVETWKRRRVDRIGAFPRRDRGNRGTPLGPGSFGGVGAARGRDDMRGVDSVRRASRDSKHDAFDRRWRRIDGRNAAGDAVGAGDRRVAACCVRRSDDCGGREGKRPTWRCPIAIGELSGKLLPEGGSGLQRRLHLREVQKSRGARARAADGASPAHPDSAPDAVCVRRERRCEDL